VDDGGRRPRRRRGTLGLLATAAERAREELLAHTEPVRWLALDLVVEEVDRGDHPGAGSLRGSVRFADGSPGLSPVAWAPGSGTSARPR
jgi:hypothetical protein